MASYYGPGSTGATPPPGYGGGSFYSAPSAAEYERNSIPYHLTPYGASPYGGQLGRTPGMAPMQDAQGNLVGPGLSRLGPGAQQFSAQAGNPYGMPGPGPGSSMFGMGGGGGGAPWSTGGGGGGGGPFGAVTPDQLAGLLPPGATPEDIQGMRAAGLAFQEYERVPGLYGGQLSGDIESSLRRQMSGQDQPFTPTTLGLMKGQAASAASSGARAAGRRIADVAGGRGLGGGAAQLGLNLQAQEQAAQRRQQANTMFDITGATENFAAGERGRAAGASFLGQQARDITPSILAKGQALAGFQNFGQGAYGGLGDALAQGFGGGGLGSSGSQGPMGVVSYGSVRGLQPPPGQAPDPWQQQMSRLQQIAAMFGMGGGKAQQAGQAGQTQAPGGGNPYDQTLTSSQRAGEQWIRPQDRRAMDAAMTQAGDTVSNMVNTTWGSWF